jgi:hypothetical protein
MSSVGKWILSDSLRERTNMIRYPFGKVLVIQPRDADDHPDRLPGRSSDLRTVGV